MKLKTPSGTIHLGEWTKEKCYWFRHDLSEPKSEWARQYRSGHNNSVGFIEEKTWTAPRFFGEGVRFLIEEWSSFNTPLFSDVEKAKQTMDNFLELINGS